MEPGTSLASRCTVVVVNYRTPDFLMGCLASLPPECSVIVIDNASGDDSVERVRREFPRAICVDNDKNVGFGVANNQGLERVETEFALLLNSDAAAHPGAVERLVQTLADYPGAMAVGGKLLNPDGSLQNSTARGLTLTAVFLEQTGLEAVVRRVAPSHAYWTTPRLASATPPVETEQLMGACILMRRGPDGQFVRFDSRYFLYCEDTDLCLRLRQYGPLLYETRAEFTHHLGQSSLRDRWRSVARYNRGKELYYRIHRGRLAMAACLLLNRLGALGRLLTHGCLAFRAASRDRIPLFWRVLTAPIREPNRS